MWQECGGKYNKNAEIQIKPKANKQYNASSLAALNKDYLLTVKL